MPVRAYNTRILVDQFDFSMDTAGGSLALSTPAIEAPTLQQAARLRVPGPPSGRLEFSGYWNGGAVGLLDNEMYARLGAGSSVVAVLLDTTQVNNPAYVLPGIWGQALKTAWAADALLTAKGAFENEVERGLVVAHQQFTAPGLGPLINFGGSSVGGGWAALFVRAIGGTAAGASFVVKNSGVSGFTSPITVATFAPVSGLGAQFVTHALQNKQYVKLECTGMGGATSLDVTAIVGAYGMTG